MDTYHLLGFGMVAIGLLILGADFVWNGRRR